MSIQFAFVNDVGRADEEVYVFYGGFGASLIIDEIGIDVDGYVDLKRIGPLFR